MCMMYDPSHNTSVSLTQSESRNESRLVQLGHGPRQTLQRLHCGSGQSPTGGGPGSGAMQVKQPQYDQAGPGVQAAVAQVGRWARIPRVLLVHGVDDVKTGDDQKTKQREMLDAKQLSPRAAFAGPSLLRQCHRLLLLLCPHLSRRISGPATDTDLCPA